MKSSEKLINIFATGFTCFLILLLLITKKDEFISMHEEIFFFLVFILFSLPIYYYLRLFVEKIRYRKIESEEIKNKINLDYYRDIIKNYSPACMSFIYNGEINYDRDLMISFFYLKKNKYIEVNDNKIVLLNKDYSNLSKDLQVILDYYGSFLKENGKKTSEFKIKWSKAIIDESLLNGLIKCRTNTFIDKYSFLEGVIAICGFGLLLTKYFLISLFAFFIIFVINFFRKYTFFKNQYPKTQKGYNLYVKLNGLKNYIADFTLLNDAEIKQLNVFDDYILYSIIFDDNTALFSSALDNYQELKKNINL